MTTFLAALSKRFSFHGAKLCVEARHRRVSSSVSLVDKFRNLVKSVPDVDAPLRWLLLPLRIRR
jgi:hypothetical protein